MCAPGSRHGLRPPRAAPLPGRARPPPARMRPWTECVRWSSLASRTLVLRGGVAAGSLAVLGGSCVWCSHTDRASVCRWVSLRRNGQRRRWRRRHGARTGPATSRRRSAPRVGGSCRTCTGRLVRAGLPACACVCDWLVVCECTCKCAYASSSAHVAHPYTREFALVACARCAGPVGDHIDPDKRSVQPDASSCAGVHSACCVPLPLLPLLRVLLPLACGRGWVDG